MMSQQSQHHKKKKIRFTLQAKLTLCIVLLIFLIISLRTTAIAIANRYLENTLFTNLLSAGVAILLGAIGAYIIIVLIIKKPLREFANFSYHLSESDFSHKIVLKSGDEFEELANSFNEMTSKVSNLVQEIQNTAKEVNNQNEIVKTASYEIQLSTEQIASTMQDLASGAEQQSYSAGELSETMNVYVDKVSSATSYSNDITKQTNEVLQMTSKGKELIGRSVSHMSVIEELVKDSVNKVENLDRQTQEISMLVGVIQNIAEQTNLLALNAAIEAARAGEHGKGFSVVASEVRKLAEQVSSSIENITSIVTNVQKDSSEVVVSLKEGYDRVERGTNHIRVTEETFNTINRLVLENVSKIESISNTLFNIENDGKEINNHVLNIVSITQEAAAGIEQTSATTQETSSSLNEVTNKTEGLKNSIENLNGLVNEFKV